MRTLAAVLVLGVVGYAAPVAAQERACMLGLVQDRPLAIPAAASRQTVPFGHVGIGFLGHSSFLIQTHRGVTAVTDFNGYIGPGFVPHIVTMNNAHSTHYTDAVDPAIRHVLRGWGIGGIEEHDVTERDLRVFNVPTNIRDLGAGQRNRNSIFVFETADLCLAHVGHLHHFLTTEQRRRLRRIDVLFLPVDGVWTMSHDEAMRVIDQADPRVVIPMHFSWGGSTSGFAARASQKYAVKDLKKGAIVIARKDLPEGTEIWFLEAFQGDGFGAGED